LIAIFRFKRRQSIVQSKTIRSNSQSYFADAQGNRKSVGNSGQLIGWSVQTAYYLPVKKVKGLMFGTAFRASLTGTEPDKGGYEEGYFFNIISAGIAAKYYPFTSNNLFVKGEFGLASVFTKNRFLNEANQQEFLHQFGIGTNASAGLGYSFRPFKNKVKTLDLQAIFQQNNARVEVNGIGNDQWSYSALNFIHSMNF